MNYPYVCSTQHEGQLSFPQLLEEVQLKRAAGARVVSTNGCFDLLHLGHMTFLQQARATGDLLIVGLNSDSSIRRLKGAGRPIVPEAERVQSLLALKSVDYVFVYHDLLANQWLELLQPDIHCKSGEYAVDDLPETPVIKASGGEVRIIPFYSNISTSFIINRITNGTPEQEQSGTNDFPVECLLKYSHAIRQMALCQAANINEIARRLVNNMHTNGLLFSYADEACQAAANYFHTAFATCSQQTGNARITPINADDDSLRQCTDGAPGILLAFTQNASASMQSIISMARQLGIVTIVFTSPPEGVSDIADITLTIPAVDPLSLCQAQIALANVLLEVLSKNVLEAV